MTLLLFISSFQFLVYQFLQLLGLTVNASSQNQQRFNMAALMIQKGADYEAKNNRGQTPLDVCRNAELKQAVVNLIQKT
jgi:hypothetical protein